MTFKKRTDVTLTEMAKWVDKNMLLTDYDVNTMIEFLYHLVFTKSQQCKIVTDYETCDDFSLFCVSKLLTRINNKKDNSLKSIVNYINTVIFPWHNEYIKLFCTGSSEFEIADFDICDFSDYLIDAASEHDYNAYSFYCFKVSDVVQQHLRKIPRKKKDSEWSNICVSCLLTLKDRIYTAVQLLSETDEDDPKQMSKTIRRLKTKPPILFHIDESMSSYVSVLVNELVHAIAAELSYSTSSKVLPSTCLKNLVVAASNEEED